MNNRDKLSLIAKGVFSTDHSVFKLFESYGWVWGGNFNELKDYHHFQKYHPDLDIWQDKLRELHEKNKPVRIIIKSYLLS